MNIMIGSARSDENKKYTGGAAGDQRQTKAPDYSGEISQQSFYTHSKGWYILRAKDPETADKIAENMIRACDNRNIGYSQSDRYGVIKYGTNAQVKCNADCSSLVRQCVKEAASKDPGDFNTGTEASALQRTGMFVKLPYTSGTLLYTGDILVTKTKGHTAIVTQGNSRTTTISQNPYMEPVKNLKYGANEAGVRWIQYELNRHGYKLNTDGIFGQLTDAAVRDFQAKNKLEIDGVVGAATRAALKK